MAQISLPIRYRPHKFEARGRVAGDADSKSRSVRGCAIGWRFIKTSAWDPSNVRAHELAKGLGLRINGVDFLGVTL